MVWKSYGDLVLIVHKVNSPTDEEWQRYLDDIKDRNVERMRTLVFTDGGVPTTAQRKMLNSWLAGRSTRVCLVSSSTLVRGVVTALSWFNPKTHCVSPERWEEAFIYLQIAPQERGKILREIQQLRAQLT